MAIEAVFFSCWGQLAKQQLARVSDFFLYISLPFLHNYDVKMPNFAFSGDGNQAKTKFYFVFELGYFNSDSEGFAYIWQSKWVGIIAIKTERRQINFLSDVLVAVASLDLKVPIRELTQRRQRQRHVFWRKGTQRFLFLFLNFNAVL